MYEQMKKRFTKDPAWIQRLRAGDHQAMIEFRSRYERMVYACGAGLGIKGEALEDITSDTFLATYRSLKQFRGCQELTSWVRRIAYHEAVKYLRKQRRAREHRFSPRSNPYGAVFPTPIAILQKKEADKELMLAMETLPSSWRTAIYLFYWQAMSAVEIADIMKVGDGVVRAYLFRGRRQLKRQLTPA